MKRIASATKLLFFIAALSATIRLTAQAPLLAEPVLRNEELVPGEEIYLHTDRDRYIAGEDLWFSIYNLDTESRKLSSLSRIAYIELLNPWNMPVIQKRFQLSGGLGMGSFVLPDSLSSGTYTIRAYTNRMKDFLPEYCFMKNIDILNPFRDQGFRRKSTGLNKLKTDYDGATVRKGNELTLTMDSVFGRREKVILRFGTENYKSGKTGSYNLSISVTPTDFHEEAQAMNEYLLNNKKIWDDKNSGIAHRPVHGFESDGHFLSVKVTNREGNISDSSDYLYMSIQGKVADFRYAGRDSAGRYSFLLPVDDKMRNLILQPDHANKNMILEIEPSFSRVYPVNVSFEDTLTENETEAFSKLSLNYQAARIYGTDLKKEVETADEVNPKKRRFYGIPEMEIILDDYTSLPSMQEVFFELLPGINLRTRKSGYEMQITNPMTGEDFNEPPLVMIDGVIINDLAVLVDLNPELVEKIEVIKTPYLIGDLILYGIVNIITRSGDFSDITMPDYAVLLPYRVVEKSSAISFPDYSDEEQRLNRKPDLRNTLYWNPSVRTGINGETEIEFWTSDLSGTYIIGIQGISETGNIVSMSKLFTVSPQPQGNRE